MSAREQGATPDSWPEVLVREDQYVTYESAEAEAIAYIRILASRVMAEQYATPPGAPGQREALAVVARNRMAVAAALLRIADEAAL